MKNDQTKQSTCAHQTTEDQSQRTSSRSGIFWFFLFILLADVVFICFLIAYPHADIWNATDESYKRLWDLAVVVIVAGVIPFSLEIWKGENEKRDNKMHLTHLSRLQHLQHKYETSQTERRFNLKLYSDALTQYNNAKRCRRLLRAKAVYTDDSQQQQVILKEYIELITELQLTQLNIEALKRLTQIHDDKTLSDHFKEMENYLGAICKDFEIIQEEKKERFEDGDSVEISMLANLEEFILESKKRVKCEKYPDGKEDYPFYKKFVTPFKKIEEALIEIIKK